MTIINTLAQQMLEIKTIGSEFRLFSKICFKLHSAKNGNRPLKLNTLKLKNKPMYDVTSIEYRAPYSWYFARYPLTKHYVISSQDTS